ncbi:expressed unknown protein [Seminavis robusta]|uniref:Uncharacterized protein n=1 Tax=Seminavis robusta TaxID=568900 RepID=A0A9N8HNI3_9STRA|nr:expressed unknown protein [Seminavis robusta]|eukprot:Sro988_g228400.1 n/a (259) ;mRNA; f:22764-23540
MEDDDSRSPRQKRPRPNHAFAPSPSSVMNHEMMVLNPTTTVQSNIPQDTILETPAAKRLRQEGPAQATNGGTTGCHIPAHVLARHTVSMERDDQYDHLESHWWKAPPTAPQLLPACTMGLGSVAAANANPNNTTTSMMGCNACQRFFIPPTISNTTQQNTLLNYFTSSKPKPAAATAPAVIIDKAACLCTFCERSTCAKCLLSCEQCLHAFCTLCSTQAYVASSSGGSSSGREEEQTLCLDCASMLDLPQGTMDMMEG